MLNEIEYAGNNTILANKWLTDDIYKIDLKTGKVLKKYDMSLLKSKQK